MGCDIHAHFEIKVKGEWVHYSKPDIGRNYDLFGHIAGVRGGEAIVEPRGIPQDASLTVLLDVEYYGTDGHTHTWLCPEEIMKLYEIYNKDDCFGMENMGFGYLYGNGWDGFLLYPKCYPDFVEDFRFICWFDS